MKKIIDCFIFFNELDLLEFRLLELEDVVDYFVLVESNKTFSNNDKPWNFEINKERFSKYLDKIVYVKVEDMPQTDNPWDKESHQRNCIMRGLEQIKGINSNDIIILTDLDEIPDAEKLFLVKHNFLSYNTPIRLNQDMYYYNFNCKANLPNTTALLIEYGKINMFNDLNQIVRTYWHKTPEKFGWHLSYFGNTKWIIEKIKAFSHQEYNNETYTNEETINKTIEECGDLFFRDNKTTHDFNFISLENNKYLPKNYKIILKNEK